MCVLKTGGLSFLDASGSNAQFVVFCVATDEEWGIRGGGFKEVAESR